MKLKKGLFSIVIVILVGVLICSLIYFKREENAKNFVPQGVSDNYLFEVKKKEQKIIFYFRMREKFGIKPAAQIFPKKLEVQEKLPSNGLIVNFLNFYFPNGEKYYSISLETLNNSIYGTNYVFLKPKPFFREKKPRGNITALDLEKLNINSDHIKLSQPQIIELLALINDSNIDGEEVKFYLRRHLVRKNIEPVTEKIFESIYFY